jgi:hypothetical protein
LDEGRLFDVGGFRRENNCLKEKDCEGELLKGNC